MKKLALSLCILALAYVWGGSAAQAAVTLTLVPSSSSVALGGTLTLTATVAGTSNLGLTWSVNGATNGNSTQGTLTACTTVAPLTCKYTAPAVNVPSPNPVTFKIVSTASPTVSQTTTATVTDSIAVSLTPTSKSLALSATQVFTATISGTTNTVLDWYVNGVKNGSSTQGTLTACTTASPWTCTYTAPPVDVPSPNPAVIEVASAADPAKNKTASVTVTDSIAVTLTPSSASIALSGTQVLTATITGATSNAALNWYVNGVKNGNSAQGTLTACTTSAPLTCKYTAPPVNVPNPNPAVIEVASSADPGKNKTAKLTVTDPIAVTLTPSSASLALSGTQVFTATITGATSNAVLNWYVNGVLNGSSAQGTLTACTTSAPLTCKYTAPPVDVPSPNPAVIKVASSADPGKNKTANVTVTDPIAVTLTPSSASIALSGTQVFTATITGATSNAAVNWYVNGVLNGNSTQGTLTACTTSAPLKCTYTAPPVNVPAPNPAVIEVASSADPGKNKSANLTVTDSIAVTLAPPSASIALSGTEILTATVTGTSNSSLNWYVNGVKNGSTAQGTLTACTRSAPLTCTYTAPPTNVPSPNPAVIEVASAADPAKNKTANLTVTDSIVVGLSPSSASLALSGTQVFTATLSGSTNPALNWYVNGVKNGNSTQGTLTACSTVVPWTCTYTAPPTAVPSPNPAVVEVASAADPAKNKTANVTVIAGITVGLTPSGASIALGGTQVFTATITGTTNTALTWYVNGVLNGSAAQGTLTGTGFTRTYTAPPVDMPSPNPAVIKVASVADTTKYKTASVTVNPPKGTASGSVYEGTEPVIGAHVYLFAASTAGYGQPSVSLLSAAETGSSDSLGAYVTTGSGGTFSIVDDYTCAAGSQVYLYALGGDAGAGANDAIGLLAALGSCPDSGTFSASIPNVWINEVSTVAAAYAFAGYATSATSVSSSGTALAKVGIANAFANAGNLAGISTGAALATTPAGNGTVPESTLNTLADILAACTSSSGPGSTPCSTLFANAKSKGSTGTAPTDTATAAINIAHNPGANVTALFGISTPQTPFFISLNSAPNDFTLGIQFTGGGIDRAGSIAIDGAGNAWIVDGYNDYAQPGAVTEFSSLGAPLSPAGGYTGGCLYFPEEVAIDESGNAWITNWDPPGSGCVTKLSSSGAILSGSDGYTAGLDGPFTIAIDGSGNAWITNGELNNLAELSSSGSVLSGTNGYTVGSLYGYERMAIDGIGNVWIVDSNEDSLTKVSSSGAVLSGSNGFTGGGLNDPAAIAIDAAGSVWVLNDNYDANQVIKFSNSGSVLSGTSGYTGGGLDEAQAIAIDGLGNAWIANYAGNDIVELSSSGAVLSGTTGYANSSVGDPQDLALDGSGNVWIPNASSVIELIGLATPVVTPLATGVKNNTLGTRP